MELLLNLEGFQLFELSSGLILMIFGRGTGNVLVTLDFNSPEISNRPRLFLLSQGLTFHLLAQVGAPAVPHVLYRQQVPLCVVDQQQRDAGHHQLIHDAKASGHLRLFSWLKHGSRLLV